MANLRKENNPQLLIFDSRNKTWLEFTNPLKIISTNNISDVQTCLIELEKYLKQNYYAAGFISYEASPAFDESFQVKSASNFPLFWFGIFNEVNVLNRLKMNNKRFKINNWQSSIDQKRYKKDFENIKEYIAKGDTYQVNYTYRLFSKFKGDSFSYFLTLINKQPTKYGAYLDIGDFVICSVSPELFFLIDGDSLISKPMKGTTSRGRYFDEDIKKANWLADSEKNCAENVMIVDMVRNDFGQIAKYGSIKVPHLFKTEKHPTVWQMTSTVSAKCDVPIKDIFTALFPAASITGAPKIRTMEIISELESTPRNIYTGCIGFIKPNRQAQFNVAIRTALINRTSSEIEYGIGGGITWDSMEDEEFTESQIKAKVLFENNLVFQLLETILWEPKTGYFLLDYHIKRLEKSAGYFDFIFSEKAISSRLNKLKKQFPNKKMKIRLLLSSMGKITVQSQVIKNIDKNKQTKLRFSNQPIDFLDKFLFHKTTNRKIYKNVKNQISDCDDVILWNENSEITETTIANIVLQFGENFYTPPIHCGLLAGTFRDYLLEIGEISEKVLMVDDLKKCDNIYVINSVRKWRKAVLL